MDILGGDNTSANMTSLSKFTSANISFPISNLLILTSSLVIVGPILTSDFPDKLFTPTSIIPTSTSMVPLDVRISIVPSTTGGVDEVTPIDPPLIGSIVNSVSFTFETLIALTVATSLLIVISTTIVSLNGKSLTSSTDLALSTSLLSTVATTSLRITSSRLPAIGAFTRALQPSTKA